jgi:four helix bundle protein
MIPCARLAVLRRATAATVAVYRVTCQLPNDEQFGLTAQLRRASVSVGANIVEGAKRRSPREFAHFLNIAEGSASESAYLLELSAELGHGTPEDLCHLVAEYGQIERMICCLRMCVLPAGRASR